MLDAWLSSSGPFRKMVEKTMSQALANLSMPSRDDVTHLAERLTNIEMRLDDLDAKLDEALRSARPEGIRQKAEVQLVGEFTMATQTPDQQTEGVRHSDLCGCVRAVGEDRRRIGPRSIG